MKLGAVSHGCCGRIRWCRLAYLSQKAASAVQKTRRLVSPVCCESRDEWEHSGASHTESLAVSSFLAWLFFSLPAGFLCLFHTRMWFFIRQKKGVGGVDGGVATCARVRTTQRVCRTSLWGWKCQWVVDINSVIGQSCSSNSIQLFFSFFWVFLLLIIHRVLSSEQGTLLRSGLRGQAVWRWNLSFQLEKLFKYGRKGRYFMRNMANVLHTNRWKHQQRSIERWTLNVWENCFYFAKDIL